VSAYSALAEKIDHLALTDSHEHVRLQPATPAEAGLWGVLASAYVYVSFHLAGAPSDHFATRPDTPEQEWGKFAPYLEAVATTSYFRGAWEGLRRALDVPDAPLDRDLYVELDARLRAAQARPGWGKQLLQETAKIDRALLDAFWDPTCLDCDRDLFSPVLRVNGFVMCPWEGDRDHNDTSFWTCQDLLGVTVSDFAGFLELYDAALDRHCRGGAKAIKLALAYDRTLEFQRVDRADAAQIWAAGPQAATLEQRLALGDYLTYYAVGRAVERGLAVQIHTGILEGLRPYAPPRTSPLLLAPLLQAHPQGRFDLFHAGFPYARELATMAMGTPQVWADLCWVPLISDAAAGRILDEWIDMLPGSKLLWGGDCANPVAALGASLAGRQVVAKTLAGKVDAGTMTRPQADRLAEMILRGNGREVFRL
jgi:hypothetical protein